MIRHMTIFPSLAMFCFLVEEVSWASVLVSRQEKQGFSISATLSIPFHCGVGAPFQEIWEVFQVCPQFLCVCVCEVALVMSNSL